MARLERPRHRSSVGPPFIEMSENLSVSASVLLVSGFDMVVFFLSRGRSPRQKGSKRASRRPDSTMVRSTMAWPNFDLRWLVRRVWSHLEGWNRWRGTRYGRCVLLFVPIGGNGVDDVARVADIVFRGVETAWAGRTGRAGSKQGR